MSPEETILNLTSIWLANGSRMTNTTTAIVQTDQQLEGLLSETFIGVSTRVLYVGMVGTFALVGIVFNIINIIVFWRQGFAEVVNISLFSLAVSDLGTLTSAILQSVGYSIWINDLVPSINFRHVQLLAGAYPHAMCARIGSLLISFISFERCLCIIVPLKVKSILTRPVAVAVIALIYLSMMAAFSLPYYAMGLSPQHQRHLNHTVLSLSYRHGQLSKVLEHTFHLVSSLIQLLAFCLVILFTIVLVYKMRQKTKWRQKTATSEKQDTISARDNKVIMMVIQICVTFIICFTPTVLQLMSLYVFPVYNVYGRYKKMFAFIWSICAVGVVICSSVNIFFYYNMSSRYAAILDTMIPWLLARKTDQKNEN